MATRRGSRRVTMTTRYTALLVRSLRRRESVSARSSIAAQLVGERTALGVFLVTKVMLPCGCGTPYG